MEQGPRAGASGPPPRPSLLEAGKGARGAAWAPAPGSFLLVIHPSPILWLFSLNSLVSPLSSCPRLRGWRGSHEGGFRWLAVFGGFSKPQTLRRPPEF